MLSYQTMSHEANGSNIIENSWNFFDAWCFTSNICCLENVMLQMQTFFISTVPQFKYPYGLAHNSTETAHIIIIKCKIIFRIPVLYYDWVDLKTWKLWGLILKTVCLLLNWTHKIFSPHPMPLQQRPSLGKVCPSLSPKKDRRHLVVCRNSAWLDNGPMLSAQGPPSKSGLWGYAKWFRFAAKITCCPFQFNSPLCPRSDLIIICQICKKHLQNMGSPTLPFS